MAKTGMEAMRGAKNMVMNMQKHTVRAVRPVRPPSLMPVALSMKAVQGEVPRQAPTEMEIPSEQ